MRILKALLNKLLIILFFTPLFSYALDCKEIKSIVLANNALNKEVIETIKINSDKNDLCFKNLMGIMYYQGIYFDKNIDLAEQIFYDIGNQNYPEAQYNFALAVSSKKDRNHKEFMALVTGIFKKYINNRKFAEIGSDARDLGFKYLENLKSTNTTNAELRELEDAFSEAIKNEHKLIADEVLKNTEERLENSRTIAALLAIGMLTYVAVNNSYTNNYSNRASFSQESNPWWDGNPMKQNLYQWPRP
jgi:hypothetical protein